MKRDGGRGRGMDGGRGKGGVVDRGRAGARAQARIGVAHRGRLKGGLPQARAQQHRADAKLVSELAIWCGGPCASPSW